MEAEKVFEPRVVWSASITTEPLRGSHQEAMRKWRVVETAPGAYTIEGNGGGRDAMGVESWCEMSVTTKFAAQMVAMAAMGEKPEGVPGFIAIMGQKAVEEWDPKGYAVNLLRQMERQMDPIQAAERQSAWQRVAEWHVDVKQVMACLAWWVR